METTLDVYSLTALWSIAASIASIILAVFAIALAVYFYTQAKRSEKEVSNSLSKIESQAETLSKITGRQLDRFTKHATERRSAENAPELEAFVHFATTVTQSIAATKPISDPRLELDSLRMAIGALYYCATSNFYAFMALPPASSYDEDNHFHATTKRLLDLTHADTIYLEQILNAVESDKIQQSGLSHLLTEYHDLWKLRVRDSASAFAHIAQLSANK